MVQCSRPAHDAFTDHIQVRPHFSPTPGLTPFPRTRSPPITPRSTSTPHPHLVAYRLNRDLLRLYDAHDMRWCPHTGLNYAGSKNWTKYEEREKVLVLVVELKEEDSGKWRGLVRELDVIRERHGLDGKVREESMWAWQGGRGVPVRFYVYGRECTDTDEEDQGEEEEEAEAEEERGLSPAREVETVEQPRKQAVPAARRVSNSDRARGSPIASHDWVIERIEHIMEQEGLQRRPQATDRDPITTRPTPPSSAATTHAPGDLHTTQQPSSQIPQPNVIYTNDVIPVPGPRDLELARQPPAVSPSGMPWERFHAIMGRYVVAEMRERGSGVAVLPSSFSVLSPSASRSQRRIRLDSPQRQPLSALTTRTFASARERRRRQRSEQRQQEEIRAQSDMEYQQPSLALQRGPPANSSCSHWPHFSPPQEMQRQERPTIPHPPQHDAQTAQDQGPAQSSDYIRQLESYLPRELLRAIENDPVLPQYSSGSRIDASALDSPQSLDTDDVRSRAADDGKSESEESSEDGDADNETARTAVQQPNPPITPPADGDPRRRAGVSPEARMAAFRAQVHQQVQEAAQRRREPPPESSPQIHALERSPVYRATPSGGGLELPADVSTRPARSLEADDDMPAYFLDGEGAVR